MAAVPDTIAAMVEEIVLNRRHCGPAEREKVLVDGLAGIWRWIVERGGPTELALRTHVWNSLLLVREIEARPTVTI